MTINPAHKSFANQRACFQGLQRTRLDYVLAKSRGCNLRGCNLLELSRARAYRAQSPVNRFVCKKAKTESVQAIKRCRFYFEPWRATFSLAGDQKSLRCEWLTSRNVGQVRHYLMRSAHVRSWCCCAEWAILLTLEKVRRTRWPEINWRYYADCVLLWND